MSQDGSLGKKGKGRLKKLLKRANFVDNQKPLSGIPLKKDWAELRDLLLLDNANDVSIPIPAILFRQGHACERRVEASDHRDIFFRLLDASNPLPSNKKRRRDDLFSEPKVPSWACLHNTVAVDQVAVLELQVDTLQHLQTIQTRVDAKLLSSTKHTVCCVPTRWFPGNHPKSMSSALLFSQRSRPNPANRQNGSNVQTLQDLYEAMMELTLTEEERRKENYPMILTISHEMADMVSPLLMNHNQMDRRPMSIPHLQAVEIVATHAIASGDENEQLSPYVASRPCPDKTSPRNVIFAMDCEMVRTTVGMELGRITVVKIVSFSPDTTDTHVVFDELVKPTNRILDYLTPYSGITAEMLNDDDKCCSIEQVQAALLSTIFTEDIVVGHSLENDFQAARWIHTRVVDTSILFRTQGQSFKYSLRHLSGMLLQTQIQQGDHCSEEDALASLQLAVRRAVEGPSWGIFDRRPINRLTGEKGTIVCVGPSDWIKEYVTKEPNSIHALTCGDIQNPNCKAVAAYLTGNARRARLAYAHWKLRDTTTDDECFESLLETLLTKASSTTVIMIALQAGFGEADKLSTLKRVRMNPKSTMSWSEDEEKVRMQASNECQTGVVFWVTSKT